MAVEGKKTKWLPFSAGMIISASILLRKAWFGDKIRRFQVKESIYIGFNLIHIIEIQDG